MKVIEIETIDNKIYGALENGRVLTPNKLYKYVVENKKNNDMHIRIHEGRIRDSRYANALEIIINPDIAEEYKDIYPDMYTAAFDTLWDFGQESKYE